MDWTLEVVLIPVTDVDRAKAFYADQLGFHVDVDHHPNDSFRVPAHAARVGLLDLDGGRDHRRGAGVGARYPSGGLRHRGGARPARRGRRRPLLLPFPGPAHGARAGVTPGTADTLTR